MTDAPKSSREARGDKDERPIAFVLMPFTQAHPIKGRYQPLDRDALDTVFSLLKSILSKHRYLVRRAESPTDILRDIVLDLDRADLVIADLTSLNPNVMYELGIRHGFCKKTVLITQNREELPFDIAGYQCLEYGWVTTKEQGKFKEDLSNLLSLLDTHPDPRYGPVHTHLGSKLLGIHDEDRKQATRKFKALLDELQVLGTGLDLEMSRISERFPGVIKKEEGGWKYDVGEVNEDITREFRLATERSLHTPAIDHLLATSYIPESFDRFGEIGVFVMMLAAFRNFPLYYAEEGLPYLIALNLRLTVMAYYILKGLQNNITTHKLFAQSAREFQASDFEPSAFRFYLDREGEAVKGELLEEQQDTNGRRVTPRSTGRKPRKRGSAG